MIDRVQCVLAAGAKAPRQAKQGDAGYDLFPLHQHTIYPGERIIIPTGVRLSIPPGYYGRIAERSGYGVKGLAVGAGVIDPNYRGEIGVVLRNLRFFEDCHDDDPQQFFKFTDENLASPITIGPDKAIAQIIFETCRAFPIVVVEQLDETERGSSGWGSSDKPHPAGPVLPPSEKFHPEYQEPHFDSADTDSAEFRETGVTRSGRKLHTGDKLPDGSTYIEDGDTSFAAG